MYRPNNVQCSCGGWYAPAYEPHPDNTKSHLVETQPSTFKLQVQLAFECSTCGDIQIFTYTLPKLYDIVTQNAIHFIRKFVTDNTLVLTDVINLNTSNFIMEKGVAYALAYLQERNIIYDLKGFEFKLTLLGWLMLWHSGY